jgi:hypothetical protein
MDATLIQQKARALLQAEEEAKRLEAEKVRLAAAADAAEKERLEREARIIAAAERQQALLRAERIEAEAKAAEIKVAEQAALDAELVRLRARAPLEILQEEMAEMKRQMAKLRAPVAEPLHLHTDGELDMRFKSSREELALARAEIDALKEQVGLLRQKMGGKFVIRSPFGGAIGYCENINHLGSHFLRAAFNGGDPNTIWTLESV